MFNSKQYADLSPEQKDAIRAVAHRLLDERIATPENLETFTDEEWADHFELLGPCDGCVPDAYIDDGDVHSPIMRKYRCIYGAGLDLAKEVEKKSRVLDPVYCYVEPSYESSTHVVIHGNGFVYFSTDSKAWNVGFKTLEDLANEVFEVRQAVLGMSTEFERYRD